MRLLMRVRSNAIAAALLAVACASSSAQAAEALIGAPEQGGMGFLRANGGKAEDMFWFHTWSLLPVITRISLLVLGLIVYIVWRFNENANPVPSRRTHNGLLEVAWTVTPALLLVFIAVPSFRLLAKQ